MHDDVPVEDREGRLSGMAGEKRAPRPANAWSAVPLWDAYVVTVLGLMAGLALLAGEGWRAWTAAGLLAAVAAGYLAGGRRALMSEGSAPRSSLLWTAGYAALFVPAAVLVPPAASALFALAPLAYMTVPPRWAGSAVGVMLFGPALIGQALDPGPVRDLAALLLVNTAILLFSMWFGGWINRIIGQSAERAALIEELEAGREQIAALSARTGAQAERERMAREIHDTLAQGFTSVVTLAQAVESELETDPEAARRHLALLLETGRENLAEARALVAGAPAAGSAAAGALEEALRRAADRLAAETGAEAVFETRGGVPDRLSPDTQVDLLRAVQESLANVRRHAAAGAVRVVLEYGADTVGVAVQDDGRGFDPDRTAAPADGSGYGLLGLGRRAEAAGGRCTVQSSPGAGTTVVFRLPLDRTGPPGRTGTDHANGAPA
ncbi:sensor histidine kinase [Nocardiopsis composta]|uniref:Oxygen sensor histidine kinase NreB n=1 Tax=Nocardiopsis composta TaxID=157465 RepID=A0A7W8QMS9_9ACTN|nr:sensor histidine kinase [Nocardiopsis composta]MBB5432690.1 signal transduction histidine kinase [Nocardiopsis composta]